MPTPLCPIPSDPEVRINSAGCLLYHTDPITLKVEEKPQDTITTPEQQSWGNLLGLVSSSGRSGNVKLLRSAELNPVLTPPLLFLLYVEVTCSSLSLFVLGVVHPSSLG